ncbi:MAG: hypothetical protein J6C30_00135, partial [Lentisphaeria bacterium]|nr:hypothetical protein [Lentisphaeria bacterium]
MYIENQKFFKRLDFSESNVILVPIMENSILTYQFKQISSFAEAVEDKSIRLRVAPQLYAVTRASSFAKATEDKSIRLRVAPQLYAGTRASSFAEAAEDKSKQAHLRHFVEQISTLCGASKQASKQA